ncbi:MAG: DUF58 domain-containing protein [Pseudomonadota bacterium]
MADRPVDSSKTPDYGTAAQQSQELAARLPDLLMQAKRIAATVMHGLHGRRRAGPGETFWQFRRFQNGEPARRIDWRRSARDDGLYVREREWEAAHTVWIALDRSPSMFFQSDMAAQPKIDRAIVLTLALVDLLVRGGERVGIVGVMRPTASRNAVERAASELALADHPAPLIFPSGGALPRFTELVIVSDLLDAIADLEPELKAVAKGGVSGHALQIIDPVEQVFPYSGRIEFTDPETGMDIVMGRADGVRDAFIKRMHDRHDRLLTMFRGLNWAHVVHHTDKPAGLALMALHGQLGGHGVPATARETPLATEALQTASAQRDPTGELAS